MHSESMGRDACKALGRAAGIIPRVLAVVSMAILLASCLPSDDGGVQRSERVVEDLTFFGITLGEPLRLPECKASPGSRTGYASNHDNRPCWRHAPPGAGVEAAVPPGTPLADTGTVALRVEFDHGVKARPFHAPLPLMVYLLDGRVGQIAAVTTGHRSQQGMFDTLRQAYGEPVLSEGVATYRIPGAGDVQAIQAAWDLQNLSVRYIGINDVNTLERNMSYGRIGYTTPEMGEYVRAGSAAY